MDSTLQARVAVYDAAFASTLVARETYLHANKLPGSTNGEYTAAINACATVYLNWWEHAYRPEIANGYVTAIASYAMMQQSYPAIIPTLLLAEHTPFALMDNGNFIGQFKAAAHATYLDASGPGGVLLAAWSNGFTAQINNEPAEQARYIAKYSAKMQALQAMQNFEDVAFNDEFQREDVRDYIFIDLGWDVFLKGVSRLHQDGIYSFPRAPGFELAELDPLPIVEGPDPDIYAIQYITSGMTPFFIRGAMLDTAFTTDAGTNTVSWAAGTAHFMTDSNHYFAKAFNAGSVQYTGNTVFIAYSYLLDALITTTNSAAAYQNNQHMVGIYYGGTNLLIGGARQSIRGSDILVGSMTPDRLMDGPLFADIQIGASPSQLAIAGSKKRIQLGSDADPLMFIGKHITNGFAHNPGYIFRTEAGQRLIDSITGLGAGTVGSPQIQSGAVQEHHLSFNSRTIQEDGITVAVDADVNIVSWSSGIVTWVDNLGNSVDTSIIAGAAHYEGQSLYVVWTPGENHFDITTNTAIIADPDIYVFLQYSGGSDVVRNFGSTIIDGGRIRTGSIQLDRLISNDVLAKLIFVGDENFALDGVEKRMLIKDTDDTTRVVVGKIGAGPLDYGIIIYDKDGNVALESGSTLSYGPVDDALDAITDAVDDQNTAIDVIEEQVATLYDTIEDIADLTVTSAEQELELFRGFKYIGALGDLDIDANIDGVNGKMQITGTYFDHPAIGNVAVTTSTFLTPWLAHLTPPGEWFTIIWSEEAVSTRFSNSAGDGHFFPTAQDAGIWKAYNGISTAGVTYTPRTTDLVIAICSKRSTYAGIDVINSYVRETQVINSQFSDLYATIGEVGDDPDEDGTIFSRLSNLSVVIATETSTRASQILGLTSIFDDATADILQLFETTADTDEALTTYSLALNARMDDAEADISTVQIATATNASAIAGAISTFNARFDDAEADITTLTGTTASQGTSIANLTTSLNSSVTGLQNAIDAANTNITGINSNLSTNYSTTTAVNGLISTAVSTASTTLRSLIERASDSLTKNPTFSNYNTTPGLPNNWNAAVVPSGNLSRQNGFISPYSVRIPVGAGATGGITQQLTLPNGKYNFEYAVSLVSGAYTGGGVLIQKATTSETIIAWSFHDTPDIKGDISTSKTGLRFFRPASVDITTSDGLVNIYLYSHSSVFGQAISSANSIDWHQGALRALDAADAAINNVSANLSTNYSTTTTVNGLIASAVSSASTTLNSRIDNEVQTINNYGESLLRNATFANYPTTPGAPTSWTSTGSPTLTRQASTYVSPYVVRIAAGAATAGGMYQNLTNVPNGKYIIEVTTNLSSGDYTGSGVRLATSADATITAFPLAATSDNAGTTSSNKAGIRVFAPPEFTVTTSDGIVRIYLYSHLATYGSIANANAIDWYQVYLYPIVQANLRAAAVEADLASNYSTTTVTTGLITSAVSAASLTLSSYIDQEIGDLEDYVDNGDATVQGNLNVVSSNLSTNYSTTTTVNGLISSAVSAASTTLNSRIDGEVLTINNYSQHSIFKNGKFAHYPTTPGMPTNWTQVSSPTVTRQASTYVSPYFVRIAAGASVAGGIAQQITGVPNGKYLLEVTVGLNTGTYAGAGVRLENSAATTIYTMPFSTTPDTTGTISASKAGLRTFAPAAIDVSTVDGVLRLYLHSHLAAIGVITSSIVVDWYEVTLYPVTEASLNATSVAANLSANYTTSTLMTDQINESIASAVLDLSSYIDDEVSDIGANLTLNYYTKAVTYTRSETGALINSSIAGFDLSANSYFDDLSSTVLLQGSSISSLEGSSAYFDVLVAATGSTNAVVSLLAGSSGSSVGISADQIYINTYDGTTVQKAIGIVGTTTTIYGDLAVGGAITVGGTARLKLALESFTKQGADGAGVTWAGGVSIGNIPTLILDKTGLAPLTTGEQYAVYLTDVTPVGATVYAKIVTPITTTPLSNTVDAAGGSGNPTRVMAKSDVNDAYNAIYYFNIAGQIRIRSTNEGGFYTNDGDFSVNTWFNSGSGWVQGPSFPVDCSDAGIPYVTGGSNNGLKNYTKLVGVSYGTPIGAGGTYAFGVSIGYDNTGTGSVISDLASVVWYKQNASGLRTASPNGELVNISVFPRNA